MAGQIFFYQRCDLCQLPGRIRFQGARRSPRQILGNPITKRWLCKRSNNRASLPMGEEVAVHSPYRKSQNVLDMLAGICALFYVQSGARTWSRRAALLALGRPEHLFPPTPLDSTIQTIQPRPTTVQLRLHSGFVSATAQIAEWDFQIRCTSR